jgi:hypothetical protein
MLWGVVNHEATPEPPALELAQDLHQRDLRMNVQVIEREMNPPRVAIALGDLSQGAHEGRSFAIGGGEREPISSQRLDDTEDVCRAAADVFIVSARQPARPHRHAGLRVFVENDRALVKAHDRLQRAQLETRKLRCRRHLKL